MLATLSVSHLVPRNAGTIVSQSFGPEECRLDCQSVIWSRGMLARLSVSHLVPRNAGTIVSQSFGLRNAGYIVSQPDGL